MAIAAATRPQATDAMTAEPMPQRPWRRRLADKRAIVTGASSGVGRAVALELSRRGVQVLATARRVPRLDELVAQGGRGPGAPIHACAGDICDSAFRTRLVAEAVERLGGIDLVVAAAGGGAIGRFRDGAPETLAGIFALDLMAPAELVRIALPAIERGRDPALVLVGSILGLHPLPLHADYCAAKAALRSLAGSLRTELAPTGIDVMLASLGPTASEFWDALLAGERPAWSRGRPLAADFVARAIADGLERRRAEIFPGWQAKGYAFAARFLPGLIDRIAARHLRGSDDDTPPGGRSHR